MSPVRLRHLTLTPTGGIGNRLRAIASARRLCRNVGARCSVIWDWGRFDDYFEPPGDVEFISPRPMGPATEVRHALVREDPSPRRTVDVTVENVALVSGTVFWGSHEKPIGDWAVLRPFVPEFSPQLRERADEFDRRHAVTMMVGMHIRRTDHQHATRFSPDRLFIAAARAVVGSKRRIFLATDNAATAQQMHQLFPGAICTLPKRTNLDCRWPRPFTREATEDDLVELLLLARTSYILGSYWSSYSYLAIILNGSKRSRILELKGSVWLAEWARRLRWWRQRLAAR
jgi:hypothetical protein